MCIPSDPVYSTANVTAENDEVEELDVAEVCHSTTEASPLALIALEGLTHIVQYVNQAFCQLADTKREDLIGKPFVLAVPEARENGCLELIDRVYRNGGWDSIADQEHRHATSKPIYWSYSTWAILSKSERPVGVMLQVSDVTEAALMRLQMSAINERLLVASVQQHELREVAYEMNARLERAMRETDHRVKNNMQGVVALANIALTGSEDMIPASTMQRVILHCRTLAELHDLLTQRNGNLLDGDSHRTLDTQTVLNRLLFLIQSVDPTRTMSSEICPLTLSINKSISLSLLMSELITNALKHGAGDTFVTLVQAQDSIILTVRDEGEGFPAGFDLRRDSSTGLELAETLARHDLIGTIDFANLPEGGACVTVSFPLAAE